MKPKLVCVVFLLMALTAGHSAKAYNIKNHVEYYDCLTVSCIDTLSGNSSIYKVYTYWGDGSPVDSAWCLPICPSGHTYALPGTYSIKQVLCLFGVPQDSVSFNVTMSCKVINIKAYADNNSDCIYNSGDSLMHNPYQVEVDSNGTIIDTLALLPGGSGNYIPKGNGTYHFRAINYPPGISMSCPASGVITVTVTSLMSYTPIEFGFTCSSSPFFDMEEHSTACVNMYSQKSLVIATSNSCSPVNATLTMTYSPKFNFQSATPWPASVVGNVITWNLNGLSLINPYLVSVRLMVSGSISSFLTPGDTVQTKFLLTPLAGDANTANNSENRIDTVKSSFDPNDKQVSPRGNIASGTELQYAIQFENDGNDTARDIHILDTLSSDLDASSFRFISATHPVNVSKTTQSGQDIIKFDFPGINLPDSIHHDYCSGFVVFSIKAKNNLADGVKINNRAGIYFDANTVVMTPTAQNTIGILSVRQLNTQGSVAIFPNPAKDILTIRMIGNPYQTARVYNTMGQLVSENILGRETKINMGHMPAGIYHITLKGEAGIKVEKFEKL